MHWPYKFSRHVYNFVPQCNIKFFRKGNYDSLIPPLYMYLFCSPSETHSYFTNTEFSTRIFGMFAK